MIWIAIACTSQKEEALLAVDPPQFSIEEVEEKTNSSLATGLPTMLNVQAQYEENILLKDANCPDFNGETDGIHGNWLADCTTENGAYFYGFATYFEQPFGSTEGMYASALTASFEIVSPEGELFIAGGTALIHLNEFPQFIEMRISGTFHSESEASWMEEGSVSLQVFGELNGTKPVDFMGGIQYPKLAIFLNEMNASPEQCNGTPQGELDIRDPSGYWFTYISENCDPCGSLLWRGYPYGTICLGEQLQQAASNFNSDLMGLYP
jgi:hypothetical protein